MDNETNLVQIGLIKQLKDRLFSNDFLARHRQDVKDFTRKRCLTFVITVMFLLNLLKRSLQDELDEFFKVQNGTDLAVRIVTKSAFTQARKKLKYEAFIELNQVQTAYFYQFLELQRWYGWRLVAVDGSTVQLPNTQEVLDHFGAWQPAKGAACPIADFGEIAHLKRSMPHSREGENAGQSYCTSSVRHGPYSAQLSLGITL